MSSTAKKWLHLLLLVILALQTVRLLMSDTLALSVAATVLGAAGLVCLWDCLDKQAARSKMVQAAFVFVIALMVGGAVYDGQIGIAMAAIAVLALTEGLAQVFARTQAGA